MRLICRWQQRQLARHVVLNEQIRPVSFLGRHLADCMDCAQAQQEMASLQSDMDVFSPPTLAPDFDARLMARFKSHLAAGVETAARKPRASRPAHAFSFTLRPTLALMALMALVLWNAPPGTNRIKNADNMMTDVNMAAVPPREIDLPAPDTVFNKRHKLQRNINLAGTSPDITFRSALHTSLPYSRSRGNNAKRNQHLASRLRHRHQRALGGFTEPLSAQAVSKRMSTSNIAATNVFPEAALVTQTVLSWREAGKVYAVCGDFSRAAQAYGQAFAFQPDADLAIEASESAERAGDRGASLEYYARALATEPDGTPLKPFDADTHSDLKGNPK